MVACHIKLLYNKTMNNLSDIFDFIYSVLVIFVILVISGYTFLTLMNLPAMLVWYIYK